MSTTLGRGQILWVIGVCGRMPYRAMDLPHLDASVALTPSAGNRRRSDSSVGPQGILCRTGERTVGPFGATAWRIAGSRVGVDKPLNRGRTGLKCSGRILGSSLRSSILARWRQMRDGRPMQSMIRRAATSGMWVLVFAAATTWAQETVRLRGTIERVDGQTLVVKSRDGAELNVVLDDKATLVGLVKSSLSDLKPGLFAGVTGVPQADGSQKSLWSMSRPS